MCFVEDEGGNTVKRETILYISDPAACSDQLIAALEVTGYDVVSTDNATQGIAVLYIMHSVAAVVLDHRATEQTGFDVARSLRAIRPGVPIILLNRDPIDCLPPCVDACVITEELSEKIASTVRSLLTGEDFEVHKRTMLIGG